MESQPVTIPLAFLAGLVSFITPCVLPLVPVYLSILSGSSFDQLTGRGASMTADEQRDVHRRVLFNALAFILGFSIIFILAGVVAGSIGDWLNVVQYKYGSAITNWMLLIFGIILLFLGVNMAGIWKPMFLNTETRFRLQKGKFGLISSGIVGAAFAFGWTPCIGPILAPILLMAAESGNRVQGAVLLASYSLGLALPFFISALSVNLLIAFSNKMKRHFHTLEIIVGAILIIIGIAMVFLGGFGIKNNSNGLDLVRQKLGVLDEFTSSIEMSLVEQGEEQGQIQDEEESIDRDE